MQEMTKQTIKRLLIDVNHALTVEDFDDIEELDALADTVAGVSASERRLLNSPFELCGIKFYPLTVAKSLWFAEKVKEWEIGDDYTDAFMFWILTLPLKEEAFEEFELYKSVNKAMKKLARKMHFTHDEINEICTRCIGSSSGESSGDAQFGGMIACLIREFGQSPDYWLYQTPIEKIHVLYDQIIARVSAEENANRAKSATKGKAKAQTVTTSVKSLGAFQAKVREIESKWRSNDGD